MPSFLTTSLITTSQYSYQCLPYQLTFQRALDAGATTVLPLADRFWGDRYGIVADPFGHRWAIATRTSEQPGGRIGPYPHSRRGRQFLSRASRVPKPTRAMPVTACRARRTGRRASSVRAEWRTVASAIR